MNAVRVIAVVQSRIVITVCLTLVFSITVSASVRDPLYVLSLLPYSDSNGKHGWDRGLELLPAARVAVRHINNRTDILPGYEIRLIERASDACGRSVTVKSLQNFVSGVLMPNDDSSSQPSSSAAPIAVVGLACSTGTSSVSAIAGRVDFLQLVMANSVLLRDNGRFPHLWRLLASSDDLVGAAIALMERYNWHKVGLLSDGAGFFFQGMATTFRTMVKDRNMELAYDEAVDSTSSAIKLALNLIRSNEVRIIFAPTTTPEVQEIMCQAASMDLIWPGYVWILPSRSYQDLTNYNSCENMNAYNNALNNVILVDFELSGRSDNVPMASGKTYSQYREDYDNEYMNIQRQYNGSGIEFSLTYNTYANPMYDELWALALALNNSLDKLEESGFNLKNYRYNMPNITRIIEDQLVNVSFVGTSNGVYFNEHNEVPTSVNIFQVRHSSTVHIGHFKNRKFTLLSKNNIEEIPSDVFEMDYEFQNIAIVIELYTNALILFLLTTILLVMSLFLRKEPELLAFSPLLSILIFLGCYFLQIASVLTATQNAWAFSSSIYVAICYLGSWLAQSGIYLIATTVLLRLVRIYRIFTHFGKTSKLWRDQYLFFVIIAISCCPDSISIIGFIIDPLHVSHTEEYDIFNNPPIIRVTSDCASSNGFSTVSYIIDQVYTAVLVLLLLVFAVLTRKVNNKNFKDTKKILVFVFLFVLVTGISAILYFIFNSSDRNTALIILSYSYQVIGALPIITFIAPKTLPAFYYRIIKKEKRTFRPQTEKNATITAFVRSISFVQK